MKKHAKVQKDARMKLRIHRDDEVLILAGRDKGKKGKVLAVLPKENRVVVEGVNMVKKHVKARRGRAGSAQEKGQRVSVAAPLHISNVQLICPHTKKGTRVSITRENGMSQRVSKQSGKVIE